MILRTTIVVFAFGAAAATSEIKSGVANHGPLLGWAIAKGHKIEWMSKYNNWMPKLEGTPQDGAGIQHL